MDLTFPEYQFEELVDRSDDEPAVVEAAEHGRRPEESLPCNILAEATLSATA